MTLANAGRIIGIAADDSVPLTILLRPRVHVTHHKDLFLFALNQKKKFSHHLVVIVQYSQAVHNETRIVDWSDLTIILVGSCDLVLIIVINLLVSAFYSRLMTCINPHSPQDGEYLAPHVELNLLLDVPTIISNKT